jgi:Type II secretion system protein C
LPARRFGKSGTLLVATVAGLAYGNWLALNQSIETSPVLANDRQTSVAPATAAADEKSANLGDFSETLARPLFRPDRRPAPPEAEKPVVTETKPEPVEQVAAAPPPSNLRLLGTLRSGVETTRALLKLTDSDTARWVEIGGELGGWRLREIGDDRVVVEAQGKRSTLVLYPVKVAPPALQ